MIPGGLISALLSSVVSINLTITTNTTDFNLQSALITAGWDGNTPVSSTVTINSGVTLSASTTTVYAFDEGTLPAGSSVRIINSGTINGKGGNGGAGGFNAGNGQNGSIGGNSFRATVPTSFNNLGTINSGGGGQGGSAASRTGSNGSGIPSGCSGNIVCNNAFCTQGICNNNTGATGATGGSNGLAGANGSAGSSVSYGTSINCAASGGCTGPGCNGFVTCSTGSPGTGGLAGAAIVGNSNITWINTGTINGGIT